jgi:hypothetical protein
MSFCLCRCPLVRCGIPNYRPGGRGLPNGRSPIRAEKVVPDPLALTTQVNSTTIERFLSDSASPNSMECIPRNSRFEESAVKRWGCGRSGFRPFGTGGIGSGPNIVDSLLAVADCLPSLQSACNRPRVELGWS